jgi:hypothetical protein
VFMRKWAQLEPVKECVVMDNTGTAQSAVR